MHVLIRENDVDYVKKRFESQFIFDKKLKFENEVVVSDNGNMNFWNPRAFLPRKNILPHTLPINRAGRKLPKFDTGILSAHWESKN